MTSLKIETSSLHCRDYNQSDHGTGTPHISVTAYRSSWEMLSSSVLHSPERSGGGEYWVCVHLCLSSPDTDPDREQALVLSHCVLVLPGRKGLRWESEANCTEPLHLARAVPHPHGETEQFCAGRKPVLDPWNFEQASKFLWAPASSDLFVKQS